MFNGFNTQPPEGGCKCEPKTSPSPTRFQHTAARRRLLRFAHKRFLTKQVSTHSRPKAAASDELPPPPLLPVSTHSRPKAAAFLVLLSFLIFATFQHTAARRRLLAKIKDDKTYKFVSTHSRPKAAALKSLSSSNSAMVSTHSRPKAAASNCRPINGGMLRFNTQPPEGGCNAFRDKTLFIQWFQHTAARRRLLLIFTVKFLIRWFQHTAARRRLLLSSMLLPPPPLVSTHSRPKAAAPYIKKQEKSAY